MATQPKYRDYRDYLATRPSKLRPDGTPVWPLRQGEGGLAIVRKGKRS